MTPRWTTRFALLMAALVAAFFLPAPDARAQNTTINQLTLKNCVGVPFSTGTGAVTCGAVTHGYIPNVTQKSAAYSVASADCGWTHALAGDAFYAVTFAAATGFPTGCSITLQNADSGRAKTLTVSGSSGCTLWPGQRAVVVRSGSAWNVACPGRWILKGPVTFNVDPVNGSSSADGLGTGSGAFQTLNQAMGAVCASIDAAGQQVIIQGAAAGMTFNESVNLCTVVGATSDYVANVPIIRGSPSGAAADSTINCNNASCFRTVSLRSAWKIKGFTIRGTGYSFCINSDNVGSLIFAEDVDFGCAQSWIVTAANGAVETLGNWTGTGATQQAFVMTGRSMIIISAYLGHNTATLASASSAGQFVYATEGSLLRINGMVFSGKISNTGACFYAVSGAGAATGNLYVSNPPCNNTTYMTATGGWIN